MKVLFLSLAPIASLEDRGIYPDLLRVFVKNGHFVRIISTQPDRATYDDRREGYAILYVQTPQMQKVGYIQKGFASLQIGPNIRRALDRYCWDEHYDLILMATPPITLAGVVAHIKKRDGAKFYLLLKDIWPQGIADLGVISQNGPVYRYFRAKEKTLYALTDWIGCMSPANVDYVLRHNPQVDPHKVELCPNSEEPDFQQVSPEEKRALREEFGVPIDKKVFLYGGNLGAGQCIPFLVQCLKAVKDQKEKFFIICGTGKDVSILDEYVAQEHPEHVMLIHGMAREDYNRFMSVADVGLIFTDFRFTIPNFPSRLLSYLQKGLPVLSCTDLATDIGDIIEQGGFGWKCTSDHPTSFLKGLERVDQEPDLDRLGQNGQAYMLQHYTAADGYRIIAAHMPKES